MSDLLRLAAFTLDPAGGNPAGVWIGETLPPAAEMQRIAADVRYSETAFLAPDGTGRAGAFRVRYFSPAAEVPFCGHATIASGVALAGRTAPGRFLLTTNDGLVTVDTQRGADGQVRATLTSVEPRVRDAEPALVADALAALRWQRDELDETLPPAVAYAGASHLVLAARTYERLRDLDYDFDRLRSIMLDADLTTVQLAWREAPDRFRVRDPFPVGNVVEDPATGAAAAALGAYLRWRGEVLPPARLTISQGVEMGRPSLIEVDIPDASGGIRVSGTAVSLD
ncbi:MAG TPA: PhzF family phenazine biosynthesis isomerase [Candidatus Limnocylindrales bacterium]|nr:PhzF family phenazine biosynthesis isomerase [Candidatus Limnocylindrales bacterium]